MGNPGKNTGFQRAKLNVIFLESAVSNEDRLKRVFANVFQIPDEEVTDELAYREFPKWDSLAHMALVAEIDAEFDSMLDMDEIIDLSSFKRAKEILSNHDVVFE